MSLRWFLWTIVMVNRLLNKCFFFGSLGANCVQVGDTNFYLFLLVFETRKKKKNPLVIAQIVFITFLIETWVARKVSRFFQRFFFLKKNVNFTFIRWHFTHARAQFLKALAQWAKSKSESEIFVKGAYDEGSNRVDRDLACLGGPRRWGWLIGHKAFDGEWVSERDCLLVVTSSS